MSLRPAPDVGNPPHQATPYYVRDTQHWAVVQENQRHDQAMWTLGENAMFVLMWHVLDFEAGLVDRCSACYIAYGKVAEVYKQPARRDCPTCFGTTFEGGYKARIVRPALFSDTNEEERVDRRGVVRPQSVSIESTSDFRIRQGDYCFRADGTRWWLRGAETVRLRTGFGYPGQSEDALNVNISQASLEDNDSVAYQIPPDDATVKSTLALGSRIPYDFSSVEVLNAPLISGGRQP
jgi:hypothetical protein